MNATAQLRVPPGGDSQPPSPIPGLPLVDLVDLLSDDLLEVLTAGDDGTAADGASGGAAVVDLVDLLVE